MNNLKGASIISAAFFTFSAATIASSQPVGGDAFEPVWVDSLRCKANGTKGCTVHRRINVSAGPDRVFVPDSIEFKEQSRSGRGKVYVRLENDEMVSVPVTVAGSEYKLEMPRKVNVVLHAESGSGPKNYNRGAWINGYLHGRTLEVDR